ncbi:MAG: D-alanyl-D-alanine carboxypeptidase [Hungatella sp.]|nr:D-alanyl-D-alanine carboxypeptidase [Hungatella sp.]
MDIKKSFSGYILILFCAGLFGIFGWGARGAQEYAAAEDARPAQSKVSSLSQTPQLKLNAQSAVLMDGETGRILYGKEADLVRPMASTTKIMTCILALEQGNLEDEAEVSSYAAGQPKVHLGAPAGRRFRLGDLLYSLMLESHNDSAVMVAESVAGDVKTFAAMMNEKAEKLGCENTWFITPNGLDAKETDEKGKERLHSTTARDLAAIMRYCTWGSPKSQEFLRITQTQNYYFTDLDKKGSYSCVNHNAFLTMMEGVLSGKTGFTGGAGYSYVASMEKDGRKYVIALLGCGWPPHKTYKWKDARALFDYGLKEYHHEELKTPGKLEPILVDRGIPGDGQIGHEARVEIGLKGEAGGTRPRVLVKAGEQIQIKAELPQKLTAPVQKGAKIGQLVYILEGTEVYKEPVYAMEDIKPIDVRWCLRQIFSRFFFYKNLQNPLEK